MPVVFQYFHSLIHTLTHTHRPQARAPTLSHTCVSTHSHTHVNTHNLSLIIQPRCRWRGQMNFSLQWFKTDVQKNLIFYSSSTVLETSMQTKLKDRQTRATTGLGSGLKTRGYCCYSIIWYQKRTHRASVAKAGLRKAYHSLKLAKTLTPLWKALK